MHCTYWLHEHEYATENRIFKPLIWLIQTSFQYPVWDTRDFYTCVNAEHSTYLTAFSSFASFSPCSNVIGFCLFLANFSIVAASSRKSICVPTNRKGVFWQWCVISGTHWKSENALQTSARDYVHVRCSGKL